MEKFLEYLYFTVALFLIPSYCLYLFHKRRSIASVQFTFPSSNYFFIRSYPFISALVVFIAAVKHWQNYEVSIAVSYSFLCFSLILMGFCFSFYLRHLISKKYLVITKLSSFLLLPWSRIYDYSVYKHRRYSTYKFFYISQEACQTASIKLHNRFAHKFESIVEENLQANKKLPLAITDKDNKRQIDLN